MANKKLDQDIESIFSDEPEISTISGRLSNNNNNNNNSSNSNSEQEYSLAREADQRRANVHEKFQSRSWNSQDHETSLVGEHADAYGRAHLLEQNRFSNNVQNGIKDRGNQG